MTSSLQPELLATQKPVADNRPSIVAFDLDETLVNGDCAQLWLQFLIEEGWDEAAPAYRECCHQMDSYYNGHMDMDLYMATWLEPLVGKKLCELTQLLDKFAREWIAPRVFLGARTAMEEHRKAGHHLLIISASPDLIVRAIGRLFGIQDCIAIDIETTTGIITGHYRQPMSYREGKVTRLASWLANNGYPELPVAVQYFYSDSHNDLPLLEQVPYPVTVNPDARLLGVADSRNWSVREWQKTEGS